MTAIAGGGRDALRLLSGTVAPATEERREIQGLVLQS